MNKIGIVTLNGYFNYGNRLQNYALQEVLKALDYEVESVVIDNNFKGQNSKKIRRLHKFKRIESMTFRDIIKKIYTKSWNLIYKNEINKSSEIRTEIFKIFTKDYIKETKYDISDNLIPLEISEEYEYFVVGSDQVWNPYYQLSSQIYFLQFAPQYKRIAFSPSFGVSEIPIENISSYKLGLSEMSCLSVREDDGAKIIKELTGREAQVLVDPTLLLSKDHWMNISKPSINKPSQNYLLTYFLGGLPKEYKKRIIETAKSNNMIVINLGDIREKHTYRTGPCEFIDYINGCSLFCTDSFHGVVFSILFEKPFIVYERADKLSMYSRLNTLLTKFDLHSRRQENVKTNSEAFTVDFSHTHNILENERQKANDYLKNALV